MDFKSKVRFINANRIVDFYKSIGIDIGCIDYKKGSRPMVKDLRDESYYTSNEFISKDEYSVLYRAALLANDIMYDKEYIESDIKETLDKQIYKYINSQICLN